MGLLLRQVERDGENFVGGRAAHVALFPQWVESLVGPAFQFAERLVGHTSEGLVGASVTSYPRSAWSAHIALPSIGASVDLGVINELCWSTTIRAAPAEKNNRVILQCHS